MFIIFSSALPLAVASYTPEDIRRLRPLCGLTGKSKLCSPGRGSVNFIPSAVLYSVDLNNSAGGVA